MQRSWRSIIGTFLAILPLSGVAALAQGANAPAQGRPASIPGIVIRASRSETVWDSPQEHRNDPEWVRATSRPTVIAHWTQTVTNRLRETVTAVHGEFYCPATRTSGKEFLYDALSTYGNLRVLRPGANVSMADGPNRNDCVAVIDMVMLQDGSYLGSEAIAQRIFTERRSIALALPKVIEQLQAVALNQQQPKDLAGQLKLEAASLTNDSDAGKRYLLTETAHRLTHRDVQPLVLTRSSFPSTEQMMKTMHATRDEAMAATLMHDWVEWQATLKPFGGQAETPGVAVFPKRNAPADCPAAAPIHQPPTP